MLHFLDAMRRQSECDCPRSGESHSLCRVAVSFETTAVLDLGAAVLV